ncbi:MAG: chemotaxis protein CheB [Chitinophagaceae bacterium]
MAQKQVTGRRLIIIGGSSGSLEALMVILPALRKDFTIPVLIVLHRSISADNGLRDLIASRTSLQVKEADEKEILLAGWIYLAPPDFHVLLEEDGTASLDVSEKIHYSRPSIDVSFTSAAPVYRQHLTAVLLSGANSDGAAAMRVVKEYGGNNVVQDPAEAMVSYMPEQAILLAGVKTVLPANQIAVLLNRL